MEYVLRLTEANHRALKSHLFPGDGYEAVALLVCGRRAGEKRHIFTVRRVVLIPHDACRVRLPDRVQWPSEYFEALIPELWRSGDALIKVHSHTFDWPHFSPIDDVSDTALASAWDDLLGEGRPHGSIIMLPDGRMIGRAFSGGEIADDFTAISVVGNDISFWSRPHDNIENEFSLRNRQAFGSGTVSLLRRMSAAVVGCSGTGSIVVEQLARLGMGKLVLIDPDTIEAKNLNRILNATQEDAHHRRAKVEVLERTIRALGQGQEVIPLKMNVATAEAVERVAECDVVFGCMDGVEGRHLLNRLATYYLLPYFDVGVQLDADGHGGIENITGATHYVQPGLSSLLDRGVYTLEQVRAEEMLRTDPAEYARLRKVGYIHGVAEDRPAVIAVNMFFASLLVNDFLARIHPYRNAPNSDFSCIRGTLTEVALLPEEEQGGRDDQSRILGRGDCIPLLGRPSLS
jgi:hypothetical protein